MRGSQKFWLLIFTVCLIYTNYITFFTGIDYSLTTTTELQHTRAIFNYVIDSCSAIYFIMYFFLELLPIINNYLDEKF